MSVIFFHISILIMIISLDVNAIYKNIQVQRTWIISAVSPEKLMTKLYSTHNSAQIAVSVFAVNAFVMEIMEGNIVNVSHVLCK